MRYLSLFSGIEAASCAWHPLGWEPVAFAENEKFPSGVLKYRWPGVPNLGDVAKVTDEQIKALGQIDLVVAGWPCQDVSIAGKRKGFKDVDGTLTRSGLFFEAIRLIRASGARWLVAENVPGLFSQHGGRDFATVVSETLGLTFDIPKCGWANSGIAASARGRIEWAELDAQFFGLAQRRERVFFVGYFGTSWSDFGPILLERESLCWNPPPRRKARKGATHDIEPCIGASGCGFEQTGDTRGQDAVVAVTHALRADGFDASEDGTGRGTPIVPVAFGGNLTSGHIDIAAALNAKGGSGRMDFETETLIVTLQSACNAKAQSFGVRRLTVKECERLMGFPDDYTRIPWRGRRESECPDGPRYKALGNSFAVPVIRWIGKRIEQVDALCKKTLSVDIE